MTRPAPHVAVIGAGIGGLAAALRLVHAGARVTVLERASTPGGKMRTLPSVAGPVDAGPTVLTMRHVFEDLFRETGSPLEDHLALESEHVLARHFWADGTQLDLTRDSAENAAAIDATFGAASADDFRRFDAQAQMLFDAFDLPMMQSRSPSRLALTLQVLRRPSLLRGMRPHQNMLGALRAQFREPRLVQLFARYATYVGGRPDAAPALLSLIWRAEAQGVWHVRGGMHALARAIADRAEALGATFHYDTHVDHIAFDGGHACAVHAGAQNWPVDAVLFNGDPRALNEGHLGAPATASVPAQEPRSLSAYVHSFAARPARDDLRGHNVFFGDTPETEFTPLARGEMPRDPTLYVCAQDRFGGNLPTGPERFEIIMNAPPTDPDTLPAQEDTQTCQTVVFNQLARFGLAFDPVPPPQTLTMPHHFAGLFPASMGSLYGRSPHGMMAAFQRPTVRSKMKGLYLVGGGVHPGAGVPMATLCGAHAAEAITTDLALTSGPPQAAMRGGTSTGSATTAPAPSRSSAS